MTRQTPSERLFITITPELRAMIEATIPDRRKGYVIEKLLWSHPHFAKYIRTNNIKEPSRKRWGRPIGSKNREKPEAVEPTESSVVRVAPRVGRPSKRIKPQVEVDDVTPIEDVVEDEIVEDVVEDQATEQVDVDDDWL